MENAISGISGLASKSGREYAFGKLASGELQYMDRGYRFLYVPEFLKDAIHIMTCGNDKLTSENAASMSFETERPLDIYVLFADKFPVLPNWLQSYERVRANVTRQDSEPATLKGYFSLYRKSFQAGKVELNGCSPETMLERPEYVMTMGATFCMYTLAAIPKA